MNNNIKVGPGRRRANKALMNKKEDGLDAMPLTDVEPGSWTSKKKKMRKKLEGYSNFNTVDLFKDELSLSS